MSLKNAGDIKSVTKLRSGALLIESHRKQQSINLHYFRRILLLKSPHRTLNSSRGIIRYRDDDLDELTDDEICKELAHQGVTHGKRFVSKRNGQEIKLNTFLPKFVPQLY